MNNQLEEKEVISILSTALLHLLDIGSKSKIYEFETIGFVHTTVSKTNRAIKTWVIKFNLETCAFAIEPIQTNKFPDGSILYWHDNSGDAITRAKPF